MLGASDWEQIDDGTFNGVKKFIRSSDEDYGSVEVKYEPYGIDAALDRNKEAQNESFDRKSEMWHAAHIPTYIMYEWITKYGINFYNPAHQEGVKRLLNDSEYRWLKVKNIII